MKVTRDLCKETKSTIHYCTLSTVDHFTVLRDYYMKSGEDWKKNDWIRQKCLTSRIIRLVIIVVPLLGYKVGGCWVVENGFSWPENNKVNILYLFCFTTTKIIWK